jgi:hypothetical protein
MPITIMLNFGGFYVFPEFTLHFSNPGYENYRILRFVVYFSQFLSRATDLLPC